MIVEQQIEDYIAGQPAAKRDALKGLHRRILRIAPACRLWFLDGRNDAGRIVSNPNIGYGVQTMRYADGKTRDFYRIGLSANTSGISLYVIGIADKNYLRQSYGARLGKASVTGYCIRFKTVADLDLDVLGEVIRFGFEDRVGGSDGGG